ncbi:hypothetical protein [Streptomyces sp. NPDC094437]|uniref:hypothetical protein n=1 Tax=Streptomyces sp. NPDC094437 TaxID=3366060 RepID=UPI0038066513
MTEPDPATTPASAPVAAPVAVSGGVDFTLLLHAYGTAVDTPGQLRALFSDVPRDRSAAIAHLNSAILHQGTPWTATGPVAAQVSALVRRDALTDPGTLVDALAFLSDVAEAVGHFPDDLEELAHPAGRDVDAEVAALLTGSDDAEEGYELLHEDEQLADALMARAVLSCRATLPTLTAAAVHARNHPDDRVRRAATATAAVTRSAEEALRARGPVAGNGSVG